MENLAIAFGKGARSHFQKFKTIHNKLEFGGFAMSTTSYAYATKVLVISEFIKH
jgi:hypothetical protein